MGDKNGETDFSTLMQDVYGMVQMLLGSLACDVGFFFVSKTTYLLY